MNLKPSWRSLAILATVLLSPLAHPLTWGQFIESVENNQTHLIRTAPRADVQRHAARVWFRWFGRRTDALTHAILRENWPLVGTLMSHRVDLTIRGEESGRPYTALQAAIFRRRMDLVRTFYHQMRGHTDGLNLYEAAVDSRQLQMLDLLRSLRIDVPTHGGDRALALAIRIRSRRAVRKLLRWGVGAYRTSFMEALRSGNLDVLQAAFASPDLNLESVSQGNLEHALVHGAEAAVFYLEQRRPESAMLQNAFDRALSIAAHFRRWTRVERLIRGGANPTETLFLLTALEAGRVGLLQRILNREGEAEQSFKTALTRPSIFYRALDHAPQNSLEFLLELGTEPRKRDLIEAINRGRDATLIRAILEIPSVITCPVTQHRGLTLFNREWNGHDVTLFRGSPLERGLRAELPADVLVSIFHQCARPYLRTEPFSGRWVSYVEAVCDANDIDRCEANTYRNPTAFRTFVRLEIRRQLEQYRH